MNKSNMYPRTQTFVQQIEGLQASNQTFIKVAEEFRRSIPMVQMRTGYMVATFFQVSTKTYITEIIMPDGIKVHDTTKTPDHGQAALAHLNAVLRASDL